MDGTAPGGHVALAPGAVHAGEIPADRLRMVVDFSRLLRQGHEPPVGVKLCVRWRRGRGRARGEQFVGETQRRFPSVDSVHLGSALGAAPLTCAPGRDRPFVRGSLIGGSTVIALEPIIHSHSEPK